MVEVTLETCITNLGDFDETSVLTDGCVVVPHIDRKVVGLRFLVVAVFVTILVIVVDKTVVGHAALHEVVSNETVDGIVGVLQVALSHCAVNGFTLFFDNRHYLLPVSNVAFFVLDQGDAPLFFKDGIWLN